MKLGKSNFMSVIDMPFHDTLLIKQLGGYDAVKISRY